MVINLQPACYLMLNLMARQKVLSRRLTRHTAYLGLYFFFRYSLIYLINRFNNRDVRSVLAKHEIKVVELTGDVNSEESLAVLRSYEPDLFISIAGNQIFQPELFNLPKYGIMEEPLNKSLHHAKSQNN